MLFLALVCLSEMVTAQKYISRNGHVWFYSHTPVEDIEAHNYQVVSILDAADGTLQFSMLIKSFEFRIALMQEHFNENYMESGKIPKAGFTGIISNLSDIDFSKNGSYPAEVTGELTIHGVTKTDTFKGTLTVSGNSVNAKAGFIVKPKEFDITIPAVVENKIAKEIEVNVDVTYTQN